jgi:hypothetical protein
MKKSQQGFINANDWQWFLLSLVVVAGIGGWAVIEGLLWVLGHFTIGWA